MADDEVRYEWGRPQIQPFGEMGGFPGAENLILPAPLEIVVRRAIGAGAFEPLPGAITLTLIPVANPPPGHAPIAVRVEVSLNLRPVEPWTGPERRGGGRRWIAGGEPSQ